MIIFENSVVPYDSMRFYFSLPYGAKFTSEYSKVNTIFHRVFHEVVIVLLASEKQLGSPRNKPKSNSPLCMLLVHHSTYSCKEKSV